MWGAGPDTPNMASSSLGEITESVWAVFARVARGPCSISLTFGESCLFSRLNEPAGYPTGLTTEREMWGAGPDTSNIGFSCLGEITEKAWAVFARVAGVPCSFSLTFGNFTLAQIFAYSRGAPKRSLGAPTALFSRTPGSRTSSVPRLTVA